MALLRMQTMQTLSGLPCCPPHPTQNTLPVSGRGRPRPRGPLSVRDSLPPVVVYNGNQPAAWAEETIYVLLDGFAGHTATAAAQGAVLSNFLGTDNVKFTVASEVAGLSPRTYTSISQASAAAC